MAISSFLRQILYSFNTNFLLVNVAFVKKKTKQPALLGSATVMVGEITQLVRRSSSVLVLISPNFNLFRLLLV